MKNRNDLTVQVLSQFVTLCEDLAWGRTASEADLFALTKEGAAPVELVKLAEAFGLMQVKLEARQMHQRELIKSLQERNKELEEARALLAARNDLLSQTIQETFSTRHLLGQCDAIRKVIELTLSIARRPINTLILGATGTGKEVVAKMIHFNSPRKEYPFVAVNCTAIPESLFESEMFGIEKGVATGVNYRKGLIEEADGGTLFLDEIGDMSLPMQAKLLRVLEEKELARLGKSKPIPIDINVITATNVDLYKKVQAKEFREDLYYRINVAEIRMPLLMDRGDDVLILAHAFLERHCRKLSRENLVISTAAKQKLLEYTWPGNVRELNNEMERAASLTVGAMLEVHDLSTKVQRATQHDKRRATDVDGPAQPAKSANAGQDALVSAIAESGNMSLQEIETKAVIAALEKHGGNKSRAAKDLGLSREGLRKKLMRLGITSS